MSSAVIQLLVLAGIALFLILRLKNVLGTRDGFEKPPISGAPKAVQKPVKRDFAVIEGGPDRDISDLRAQLAACTRGSELLQQAAASLEEPLLATMDDFVD